MLRTSLGWVLAMTSSLWMAIAVYAGLFALLRWVYSLRGTRFSHPKSIEARSPQLGVTFFTAFIWPSPPVALVSMSAYYAFRFGIFRWVFLGTTAFFFFWQKPFIAAVQSLLGGSLFAFLIDLLWNHWLKRQGRLIPGWNTENRF